MIVIFVDLAGFTALAEAMGDATATGVVDEFCGVIRRVAAQHGLREVKTLGDAFMLASDDATAAMAGSVAAMAEMSRREGALALRIGMHAGDVVERDDDIFGRTVNLAARVAAEAAAGQILVTRQVLEEGSPPEGVEPTSVGMRRLRNIPAPVELLDLSHSTDDFKVTDPVCRMTVSPAEAAGSMRHGSRLYHFCSTDCLLSFAREPEAFADLQG